MKKKQKKNSIRTSFLAKLDGGWRGELVLEYWAGVVTDERSIHVI